jgi:hypothetical protein
MAMGTCPSSSKFAAAQKAAASLLARSMPAGRITSVWKDRKKTN